MLRLRAIAHHLNIEKMSTTSAPVHNTNKACCTVPPVQSNYQAKGSFKPYGNFKKVYITGEESSQTKIVCVFDIFGQVVLGSEDKLHLIDFVLYVSYRYFPQTQQGADIIASALKATVYMPDFFEPEAPFPVDKFPPKTDEDKAAVQAFFGGIASPPANIEKLTAFGKTLRADGAKKLGAYGFCWGKFL